jgi:hypothetical protein
VYNQMLFHTNDDDFEAEYWYHPNHQARLDVAAEWYLDTSGAVGLRLPQLIMPRDPSARIAVGVPYDLPHANCVRRLRQGCPAIFAANGVDVAPLSEELHHVAQGIFGDSVGGGEVRNPRKRLIVCTHLNQQPQCVARIGGQEH